MSPERDSATATYLRHATQIWRAMGHALLKLPEATQAVLKTRIEDGDVRWALALLLSGWRLSTSKAAEAAGVERLMKETGALPVVQQLSSLHLLLPDSFGMFVTAAGEADTEPRLAGAGAYFATAIRELGDAQRNALHAWLRDRQFQETGRALIRRFPMPDSTRPPVWGTPTATPTLNPSRPTSRSDRFDRADFLEPRTGPASVKRPPEAVVPRSALLPPSPVLEAEEVTRAYLSTLGWAGKDLEQLLAGPIEPPEEAAKLRA